MSWKDAVIDRLGNDTGLEVIDMLESLEPHIVAEMVGDEFSCEIIDAEGTVVCHRAPYGAEWYRGLAAVIEAGLYSLCPEDATGWAMDWARGAP